jgi:tetratricopeptide (TPR) repeat protein/two-component sensor histidine kinase
MNRILFVLVIFLSFQRPVSAQTSFHNIDSLNVLFDEVEKTDLKSADSIANTALVMARDTKYVKGQADALANLGRVQIRQGNNKKAIEYLFESLKIYEQTHALDSTQRTASTLVRLAGALYFEHDFLRSLFYSQKAIQLGKRKNYDNLLGVAYRVRGEVHRDEGRLDSSLYYFTEAANVFKRNNNLVHLANIYVDIGVNYYYKGEYHEAIRYNKMFYELAKQLDLKTDYSIGLHNIGEFYFLLKQYKESLSYLDSAQYYGEMFKQYTVLQDTYKVKAKLFSSIKQADSSAYYYEKLVATKDSLFNESYRKDLASIQTKMDVYRHEAENKILIKEKSIATLYRDLAIIGFIAIVSVLAAVLLRQRLRVQSQVKKKLEQEVKERTAEIVEQNTIIESINLRLQLSLNRAKVDPHFIFNVLNSIQHLVLERKAAEASDHLAKLSRLARYILEKSSLDDVTLSEEIKMLEQYISLEQLRLDGKFNYQIDLDAPLDTKLPAMLIQPYVENAIIHGLGSSSKADLILRLKFYLDHDALIISIEDNGIGRNHVKQNNQHQSVGSTLGKQRLEILSKLNQKQYEFAIEDLNPSDTLTRGTRVVLRVPLTLQSAA